MDGSIALSRGGGKREGGKGGRNVFLPSRRQRKRGEETPGPFGEDEGGKRRKKGKGTAYPSAAAVTGW